MENSGDEQSTIVTATGGTFSFSDLSCGHRSDRIVSLVRSTGAGETQIQIVDIVCEDCYQADKPALELLKLHSHSLVEDLTCIMCDSAPSRLNADLGSGLCDACYHRSRAMEMQSSVIRPYVAPDELQQGVLFIGSKESCSSIMEHQALRELGIGRVLNCCSHLEEHLPSMPYHRLPMGDSLEQDLLAYLPSAFAFIAEGVARGHATLVHCNAGVSRSGAVGVAWLMKTEGMCFDEALLLAKSKRPIITPNSNFVKQIKDADIPSLS